MNELTPKELALLASIDANKELRPFFFKKAKGLKWFDALDRRNYFDPRGNCPPAPAKEQGYVTVPFWEVTEYLVATSSELLVEGNHAYAERVLEIIRAVTQTAKEQEFSNYRTWYQFSKIIQSVPVRLITAEDLHCVDYWLDDPYDHGLIAGELGEKWLLGLLDHASEHAKTLALELLRTLFRTTWSTEVHGRSKRQKAAFRIDRWRAGKITSAVAGKSGQVLGLPAVQVYKDELQRVLEISGKDGWSSLWRAAIEDHPQNNSASNAENILVVGLRDSLCAWVKEVPEESLAPITEMLHSSLHVFERVAIYTIGQSYQNLDGLIDSVIAKEYFDVDVRHEMWHLLHNCYPLFPESVKHKTKEIISQLFEQDGEGNRNTKATAYTQAIWLAAIKHHEEALQARYNESVDLAGAAPGHPDFPNYWSSGPAVRESPKSREELLEMSIDELVQFLNEYEDPGRFQGPGIEGLVAAFKASVKTAPLKFVPQLANFAGVDSAYSYSLIEAFSELWTERKELPWDDVWEKLLEFCEGIVRSEAFWSPGNAKQRAQFIANRYWVVGSIGRLIEAGTKSDQHAFSPVLLDQAKRLLLTLLKNESGEKFEQTDDAVSVAINSPRGRCLEALINLALRCCRLAQEESNSHVRVWNDLRSIFEKELARSDAGEYEFVTLLVNYLPNFLYMSTEWVSDNLDRIFDRENYQKWLCAMQAYAYVNTVYEEIYNHLKVNQHFVHAFDDGNLNDRVTEKIIQNIVIAYLHDYEPLDAESSLIRQLFDRARIDELSQLIWFVWTLRKKDDQNLYRKVMKLWPHLLRSIDTTTPGGRKLASRLTTWSVFITQIDDTNRELLLQVAMFADEDYNSHDLLESIARISGTQPNEAVAIWRELMRESAPDYPGEAIREAFVNLVASGDEGRRSAYSIADEYLKRGNDKPTEWLREVIARQRNV